MKLIVKTIILVSGALFVRAHNAREITRVNIKLNWNDKKKVVCIASSPVCQMGMQFLCSRRVYREKEKKCTD